MFSTGVALVYLSDEEEICSVNEVFARELYIAEFLEWIESIQTISNPEWEHL